MRRRTEIEDIAVFKAVRFGAFFRAEDRRLLIAHGRKNPTCRIPAHLFHRIRNAGQRIGGPIRRALYDVEKSARRAVRDMRFIDSRKPVYEIGAEGAEFVGFHALRL